MNFCPLRSAFYQDKTIDQITLRLGQGDVVINVDVNAAIIFIQLAYLRRQYNWLLIPAPGPGIGQ